MILDSMIISVTEIVRIEKKDGDTDDLFVYWLKENLILLQVVNSNIYSLTFSCTKLRLSYTNYVADWELSLNLKKEK